ncbi:hypothetical protein CFD26_104894 [Aspergillus turcosus]|uniref:Uncharacterized protein n=1 Tax=Aspergillus turcosus TaxID=1245748 RepID=A0A3R7HRL8_9EURO|nr:hypothetical protein CFD26_104894 [Aspergillus turcosus]
MPLPSILVYSIVAIAAYYILPYLARWSWIGIPAPFPASFSNLWLLYQCRRRRRYLAVDHAHEKYGKIVRIQPHHVSIADVAAIRAIYGHGNGLLKSEYYDAFASSASAHRSLFNTRDRAEHTRKRKATSHTLSAKSIRDFEPYIQANISAFIRKWNELCDETQNQSQYTPIDSLPWFNYLAFDIIGDLAFGAPFGMVERGADLAQVRKTPDSPPTYAPAIDVLIRQGEVSATLGCLPGLRPLSKYLPDAFFWRGLEAVSNMAGIATERVTRRLASKTSRKDLLARLMDVRDAESGAPLSREELATEALTFLVAGSNTTSITVCALLHWVVRTPGIAGRLRRAIDEAMAEQGDMNAIPSFSTVEHIPYLQWVISETLRLHSTSSLGLPRQIPPGSPPVTLCGQTFHAGDVLSVPTYTMHHSKAIWGADAESFVPERWAAARLTAQQKAAFMPFGTGPRACIGRNLAEMEIKCIVAAVFWNFDFKFMLGRDGEFQTREGFLRKPTFEARARKLHEYIFSNPTSSLQNNPWATVDAIDSYSRTHDLMIYNAAKLAASRRELDAVHPAPKTILEFGTYVGTSAIAWAAMLREINQSDRDCRVYTFEMSAAMVRIARDFSKLAGVDHIVTVLEGPGAASLRKLHAEGRLAQKADVVFFDHWEEHYLPDLQLCEELDVVRPGSKIIADNTDFPGAPEYLAYVQAGGNGKVRYGSRSIETAKEGRATMVEVSTVMNIA